MPNLTLLAPNSSSNTLSKIENYKIVKNIIHKIIEEKRKKDNSNSKILPINVLAKKYNQKQLNIATYAAFRHTKEKSQKTFTAILPGKGIRWASN